jgi:outer membrane protein OmpA-like peptidoglycan-associated protein
MTRPPSVHLEILTMPYPLKIGAVLMAAVLTVGCATDEYGNRRPMTETEKGVGIGTLSGAAIGALATRNSAQGAVIGAIGGALVGGLIGNYMEQQQRDFQKALATEIALGQIRVERISEGELLVGMTGETAFEVDSDVIKPGFYSTMDKIASIVNRYGKTRLDIAGHTDSTGSRAHNMQLSDRRADSVQNYFLASGVYPPRMQTRGYGPDYPIASNDTPEGRRLNRRVDITLIYQETPQG